MGGGYQSTNSKHNSNNNASASASANGPLETASAGLASASASVSAATPSPSQRRVQTELGVAGACGAQEDGEEEQADRFFAKRSISLTAKTYSFRRMVSFRTSTQVS